MSNSIKIQSLQTKKIDKLKEDIDLNYRSRNDFVVKAVDNEIRIATFKHGLTQMGKYHFDLLYAEGLKNAYERALIFDKGMSAEMKKTLETDKEKRQNQNNIGARI